MEICADNSAVQNFATALNQVVDKPQTGRAVFGRSYESSVVLVDHGNKNSSGIRLIQVFEQAARERSGAHQENLDELVQVLKDNVEFRNFLLGQKDLVEQFKINAKFLKNFLKDDEFVQKIMDKPDAVRQMVVVLKNPMMSRSSYVASEDWIESFLD